MRILSKTLRPILAALLVMHSVCAYPAPGGGGPNQNIVVISYLANNAAGSTTYNVQGDNSNLKTGTLLSAYYNNIDNVSSILNANTYNRMPVGDWQLTMLSSTVRSVRIDLTGHGVTGTEVVPSDLGGAMPARLIENCTEIKLDITQMIAGTTIQCPAWFRFNTSNSNLWYGLGMNPTNAPGTNMVSIACLRNGSNGFCNYWTVDPIGSSTIAQLQKITAFRGGTQSTPLGNFYLTFHFEIEIP